MNFFDKIFKTNKKTSTQSVPQSQPAIKWERVKGILNGLTPISKSDFYYDKKSDSSGDLSHVINVLEQANAQETVIDGNGRRFGWGYNGTAYVVISCTSTPYQIDYDCIRVTRLDQDLYACERTISTFHPD